MKALLLAWLGTFCTFLCVAHGNLETADSVFTMHAARALWLRGDSGLRSGAQSPDWRGETEIAAYIEQKRQAGQQVYGKIGRNGLTYVWFPMGHVALLVPFVVIGQQLQRAFPDVEDRFAAITKASPQTYQFGQFVFEHAMIAMVVPTLFGATSVLLLFLIARVLGATPRDAVWSAIAIAFGTQFFPLGSETLSDGPGMCFLLAALLATVRAHFGTASRRVLALGGVAAGAAVLTRYPHGCIVPFFGVAIALSSWRRRRPAELCCFVLGGLPALFVLLAIDHMRFGSISDTGYPPFSSWFNYPLWFGLSKLMIAAGKGILWFSPVLWLVLPIAANCRRAIELRWLAWACFAIPMAMFSMTNGWQSGQCWGARYVTPAVVLLCALVLPQARPWLTHRKLFLVLFALGSAVSFTSVLAPTRGHNQLAAQAVRAMYDQQLTAGVISTPDRASVDEADHFFFLPRFSPLHAHWTYAWKSWRGDFEAANGAPRHGSSNTIEPLFGIHAAPAEEALQGMAPVHWEDRNGRHVWWVFWGELLSVQPLWLLLPNALLAVVLSLFGWRSVMRGGCAS